MRQYTRFLRIALSILGSFLLAFVVLGLVFILSNQEISGHGRGKEPGGKLRHKIRD